MNTRRFQPSKDDLIARLAQLERQIAGVALIMDHVLDNFKAVAPDGTETTMREQMMKEMGSINATHARSD